MEKKIAIGGGVAASLIGLGYAAYQQYESYKDECEKQAQQELEDELKKQGNYLTQTNAESRRKMIDGNVEYKLAICAAKGKKYAGLIETKVNIKSVEHLFIDFESKGAKIEEIQVNGQKVDNYLWNNYFIMIPKEELKEGQQLISIMFVNDYVTDGEGFHTFTDTDSKQYVYTDFEPAYCRKWIPVIDQPDIKCNMTLSVIVPEDWKAISNEIKSQEVHDNLDLHFAEFMENNMIRKILHPQLKIDNLGELRVWTFNRTPIMSTYLLHLSVGPYLEIKAEDTYKSIPMSLYCRESLYENLVQQKERYFETTSKCMEFYEQFFHHEFPFSKYDHIFCPEFNSGAMENVGAITVNDLYIFKDNVKKSTRAGIITLVTHELCHMWFGDLVTMKWWNDLWLNESFADWLSFYSAKHLKLSFDEFDFMADFNDRKAWGYSTDMSNASHPIAGDVGDTQQARSIFDGITYSKGASVLKQLMFVMGENNFSDALGIYFNKHQYSNTTLDDFFDAMSQKFSNDKFSLSDWRKDWIEKAGCNMIEPIFDRNNNKFIIKQSNVIEQFSQLRWHRINATFFKEDGSYEVHKLWIENKESTEYSDLNFNDFNAVLLNWDDQNFCKVMFDKISYQFFSQNMNVIKGVMNQKIFIRALFEMVKDAQLTSKAFLDTIQQNAEIGLNEEILSSIFSYLMGSIHHYTPLEHQDSLYHQAFEIIKHLITKSDLENDKDLGVMLAQNLVHMAKSKEHIQLLIDKVNDPSNVLTNIQISYYSKWKVVEKAFKNDEIVEQGTHQKLMDKLLEEDKSDYGKRRLLTCNVSLVQDSEQKKELWKNFMDPSKDEASHNMFAQMDGFNSRKQQDEFYHQKYFQDLKKIYHQQPITYAEQFLENLFPVSDKFEFLLENIELILVELGADELPTLRKKLIEKKDYVIRRQNIAKLYVQQE